MNIKFFIRFIFMLICLFPIVSYASTTWITGAYSNNKNISRTLSILGVNSFIVTVIGNTESNYDYFYVYDANGNQIKKLDGSINETFIINSSSVKARLVTDYSITKSGVTITIVANNSSNSIPSTTSSEKLVLVGGLHEGRVGTCKNLGDCPNWGYLTKRRKLGSALSGLDEMIPTKNRYEFSWSGDPVSHKEGGNLKAKFEKWFYKYVCLANQVCNVSFISHSWGTIIASDFIASLPSTTSVNIK